MNRDKNGALTRRTALTLALPFALAPWSSTNAATPITKLGVFALLGDGLQIVLAGEVTDSRLNRNMHESLPTRDIGFDQAALRGVRNVMSREHPQAGLQMYRATTPLQLAEQRALADGATRAELPAWIVSAIQSGGLSHVLLITRHRGDASFPVADGFSIGRGSLDGIGFYVDNNTSIKNLTTGMPAKGFLGAYAMMRMQLLEVASGDIVGSQEVRVGEIHAGRRDAELVNIWNALDPSEKVEVLRQLVEANVARVMPEVVKKR